MKVQNLEDYKVAIIIPAIKRKFLRKTLMSIFLQTLDKFHVYIGDDTSKEDLQNVILDFPQDKIPHIDSVEYLKEYFSQIPRLKCSNSEYYAVPATFEQEQCWDYHMQPTDCISPQVLFLNYQLKVSSFEEADKVVSNLVYIIIRYVHLLYHY